MPRVMYCLVFALLSIVSIPGQLFSQNEKLNKLSVSKMEAEKWREDLRFLAAEIPKRHANAFHSVTKTKFDSAVSYLSSRIPTLARHQIIVEMARLVALVGDGHTSFPLVSMHPGEPHKSGFRQYPLRLYLYKDGCFVQAATSEYALAVGARVVKIGNFTVEQVFQKAGELVSRDNEMTLKDRVPALLVIPEVLQALGIIINSSQAAFTVEKKGKQTVINLEPMQLEQNVNWIEANEATEKPKPLWLKDSHKNYWFEYLTDSHTLYLQYNAAVNQPGGESSAAFFKRVFQFVEANPVEKLVIDLRFNRGGNGVLNWPLIYGLIRCDKINQKGKLFTIIGRQTFSAGTNAAALLEQHTNTIMVGEPTGGKVNSYGDHERIILPNSQLVVFVAPNFYQNTYPWDQRQWIAPQITGEFSSEDYSSNNDPAMNATFTYRSITELLVKALSEGGVELMIKRYAEFRADPKTNGINTETDLNALGYQFLKENRSDAAIELFKLNVLSFPHSANAYDSLGDAYWKGRNRELAIENFKRALELNPNNHRIAQKLKEVSR